jgi:hypothetical protein
MCCYYFGIRRYQHPLFDVRGRRSNRSTTKKISED